MIFINICGIICEYNPLHLGHAYQLAQARQKSSADYVICVMSGSFVQRGEPALSDKFSRAKAALNCGADLVLELPVCYVLQAAQYFALGGVTTLNALNVCTHLAFGSESGYLEELRELAFQQENTVTLQDALARGMSHPAARTLSLRSGTEAQPLITRPNNLLGIEYLRALKLLNSSIQPVTIKRLGAQHNGQTADAFWSASAIRQIISQGNLTAALPQMPSPMAQLIQTLFEADQLITDDTTFFKILLYRLRTMTPEALSAIAGIAEGLEYKILKAAETAATLDGLVLAVKSKRYTYARIKRILCCALLRIDDQLCAHANTSVPYARVLGVRKDALPLLSLISKASSVPVVTAPAKFLREADKYAQACMKADVMSTDIYALLEKTVQPAARDLTEGLIVV